MVNNIEEELNEEESELLATIPTTKSKRNLIVTLLIVALLISTIGYIVYDKLQPINIEAEAEAFSLGVQYGYKASLLEIYTKAITCEPVQINNDGTVINLIDTKCLSG